MNLPQTIIICFALPSMCAFIKYSIDYEPKKVHDELLRHIEKSPLVLAAITEATHRYYYDRIGTMNGKPYYGHPDNKTSIAHTSLWHLNPDWRWVIQKSTERYKADSPITSMPMNLKPKNTIPINIRIKL